MEASVPTSGATALTSIITMEKGVKQVKREILLYQEFIDKSA